MDKIVMALIEPTKSFGQNKITVLTEDDRESEIASYFTDEINFKEVEFIGLTIQGASDLFRKRDIAFLQNDNG